MEDCGLPEEAILELYWTDGTGEGVGEPDWDDPEETAAWFAGIALYVKVTNTIEDQSATVISRLHPEVEVAAETEADDRKPGEAVQWKAWRWVSGG